MPDPNYRYFCLDGSGRLHDAQWFYADSDEAAAAHISTKHPDGTCEVWQRQRLVAELRPRGNDPIIVDSQRALVKARRVLQETARLVEGPQSSTGFGGARGGEMPIKGLES